MKKILSVYFSSERTYITLVEPNTKGLNLLYINSTDNPIDLDNLDDEVTFMGCQELEVLLNDIPPDINRISVTLPAESVLTSLFPGKPDIPHSDLKKLVDLEIRHSYPNLNIEDFNSTVVPFSSRIDGKQMMMNVIIPKKVIESCKLLLQGFGREIDSIQISQLNSINSVLYNYPEEINNTIILFGIDKLFVDISVVSKGLPVYNNLVSINDINKIGELCDTEINKLLSEYVTFIDSAFFFGQALTKGVFDIASETLLGVVMSISKLNAFRMMGTELDERTRQYCSRTAHIYPPLIGGCIPSYYDIINI